jgi:hypothetical protein
LAINANALLNEQGTAGDYPPRGYSHLRSD